MFSGINQAASVEQMYLVLSPELTCPSRLYRILNGKPYGL